MGGLLLRMMGCAGYGGEVINSDFYGKRSKFEWRNIKKAPGRRARCFFVGMWCCAEEMVRRGMGCRCAAVGVSVSGL